MNTPFVVSSTFTLRLEPELGLRLDTLCEKRGFSKTGLIKSLIRDFLEKEQPGSLPAGKAKPSLQDLVGIIHLGGDAVRDADDSHY